MTDDKVELDIESETGDYSQFEIVDVETTNSTRMLTLKDCDEKNKTMTKAINAFRKEAPVAIRIITSTINVSVQEVKRNMEILQSQDSDDDQKKRVIRSLKEAEVNLEKNEKVKTNWVKVMDLYMDILLEIDEENFCNEWRLEEMDNKMKPFRVVLKEALAVARREEDKYFSIESNSNVKDPGEKAFPD